MAGNNWVYTRAILVFILTIVSFEFLYLSVIGQSPWWLPAGATVVSIAAWYLIGRLGCRGINTNWFLTLALIIAITVIPELWLRAIDYHWKAYAGYAGLRPELTACFQPDRDLFWKRSSDEPGINNLGFHGPDIIVPKPADVCRVVVLGDSCAEQDYTGLLERCLNASDTSDTIQYEGALLAVAGYSSYQGKVIAEKLAPALEPDVAVICYGWNDHWLAYRATDNNIGSYRHMYYLTALLGQIRLVQFGRMLLAALSGDTGNNTLDKVRVPAEQYRANLLSIVRGLRHNGITVVLMTSPTSFYRLGVPDRIVKSRLAVSKETALHMHRQYNEIVRDLASRENIPLLDIEAEFERVTAPEIFFKPDGIHLSRDGLRAIAGRLCWAVREILCEKKETE